MRDGLRAARRLAFALAALVLITAAPITSTALADSGGTYGTLGHAWMTVNTNLHSPSHLSAWSVDEYLARNTQLPALGHAFKSAEANYDVNALYLLAHAMHETAFGTSYISQRFHNLFGWNAADRNPTGLATRFPTYANSIDFVASQIAGYYLSPFGKFYGGAPTLRGMHYYASDPMWGVLIARIANGIVLPTLAGRGVAFGQPVVDEATTGQTTTVTVIASAGILPDGLQAAYRFVPVAIVEAGSPAGPVPAADPAFLSGSGETSNGRLKLTVDVPRRAGRYRLELQLRDSDGTTLTEFGVPEIPETAVRVFGSDAVSYSLRQADDGLTVTVTNNGRRDIAPMGPIAGTSGGTPTLVPTTLGAWLVSNDGTPVLLATVPLHHMLAPGEAWDASVPVLDPLALTGILVVRLEVGGAPGRLGGSPPGVFRVASAAAPATAPAASPAPSAATDPSAGPGASPAPSAATDPTVSLDPTASVDPTTLTTSLSAINPTASADPTAEGSVAVANSSDAAPVAAAPRAVISIAALTPIDAATRVLLNPAWKPQAIPVLPAATSAKGAKALAAAAKNPVVRLTYMAIVSPKNPGAATVRITNTGTATLSAGVASSRSGLTRSSAASAGSADTLSGPVLMVTAVPAWGPASDAISIAVPLLLDIAPGQSVDVRVALPAAAVDQSTYLVVARVVPGGGLAAFPATLFWLRSAPMGVVAQVPLA